MSDNKNVDNIPETGQLEAPDINIAVAASEVSSVAGSVKSVKTHQRVSTSSERQIKFERAQKCLENAALVSKRIKEHRKATAELLGRPFEDDDLDDSVSEMASTVSERTGYSVATDTSTTLSVQEALNIPGISASLANTLKQKELLMERIKQYKEISKKPMYKSPVSKKESSIETKFEAKKSLGTSDITQLNNTIKEKENALSLIQVKMKAMENTILDLQEKINEKDQIIEAKNKANVLMSENFSKREKELQVILEDTRHQMSKMQENFIQMEGKWNEEKTKLTEELEEKDEKIKNLEEAKSILDDSRFEISVDQSKLIEELEAKNKEIESLKEKIELMAQLTAPDSPAEIKIVEVEKASLDTTDVSELMKKIEFLEQLNSQIRQTNKELENNLTKTPEPKSAVTVSPSKNTKSPLPTRKGGRAAKSRSPWSNLSAEPVTTETEKKSSKTDQSKLETVIQSLNKDIVDKEFEITKKDALIAELKATNTRIENSLKELQETVDMPKESVGTLDVGVSTDQPDTVAISLEGQTKEMSTDAVKDLEIKLKEAEDLIASLNSEIEAANKNMIKVKSNHKLKLKQMQKTIDNFSKVSDSNAEIIKLNEDMHQLTQKVAELEEEKGNLQLHLVDYDSGRLTESDVYKKLLEMENLAEARLKSISVLEAQKFDLVQELHVLQQKNAEMEDKLEDMSHLHSEQVSSEMKSVQLEEQVDELTASRKELELVVENLKLDKEHLNGTIKLLEEEKEEQNHKLQHYIQENIELTDKLEKLSAEKVSSAESIEIVESLTTQEKLELEQYNKGIESKADPHSTAEYKGTLTPECNENIEKLVEESAELNKKIELFTQERQEVMEKMGHISAENDSLQKTIAELTDRCNWLELNINELTKEKTDFEAVNEELNRQIEELKRERVEMIKGSVETKPSSIEDVAEAIASDQQQDDKTTGDKAISRTKSVKQLTKEILKLKNTIKEREAEIGDCQMKILSLEEQQQKQNELIHNNTTYESKIKTLIEENKQLREELGVVKNDTEAEQQLLKLQEANSMLHLELQNIQKEYANAVNTRDARINEVENMLLDYEKQVINYSNTLQQKDKEISEYINQITKLNDVSQKLKSTVELLEEEKSKDQNADLIKSLNKQITAFQRKLAEYEEKLRLFDEEKLQLLNLKNNMELKNTALDAELQKLQETLSEKLVLIKELQIQQQKHVEDMNSVTQQAKERDEEIHEIKLQLRKESIENEKLRNSLSEKENVTANFSKEYDEINAKLAQLTQEKDDLTEKLSAAENKNKELMEKLKKFAVNFKKKTTGYAALEAEFAEVQKQLEAKNAQLEQLLAQTDYLPSIQDKLRNTEGELARLKTQNASLEQNKHHIEHLHGELRITQERLTNAVNEISGLKNTIHSLASERDVALEENKSLVNQVDVLNKKMVEYEIEQKNNTNFITKISSLDAELNQKQVQIEEMTNKLNLQEQQINQVRFGYDAKLQERDMYIESLDSEISKYKSRICRLEDTISAMEDRRHSLERKADQLGSQLQEKHKAYSEYTSQEDELVSRLAVLMDHDRVVEKQLHEIESENRELQFKVQHLSDENLRLKTSLSDIQEYCNTLTDKASKTDAAESDAAKYKTQVNELENQLKRISQDHQSLLLQRKREVEELETEFNTQIENAIKEKKILSEKYEKTCEHINQLDNKLQEYVSTIHALNMNVEELTRANQELREISVSKEQASSVDYTEQYINEINRLNSVVNSKNQETCDLNNKIQSLQNNKAATIYKLESDISELNAKLQSTSVEIDQLVNKIQALTQNNERLQSLLSQKDEDIKQLSENKKMFFEINIPKTEGMVISSTIEPLKGEVKHFDMSSIESQILPDVPTIEPKTKTKSPKTTEDIQKQAAPFHSGTEEVTEPEIVPKKSYLCYKGEEDVTQESDPFNSDDGWGLGESEEGADVTPGLSHLQEQLQQLQKINDTLKAEAQASNIKLLKAMKKLKELKSANDMLSNELKISKQISQSSFLDSAIEDELRINIQDLEKKLEEINTELNKEKREKEAIKKQNEVFSSANERLTEMKEKMDSEIELWKFKFKEANDKMSTLQWEADTNSPDHKPSAAPPDVQRAPLNDEIQKLEKENDELHQMTEQLNLQNNELSEQLASVKEELTKKMNEQSICNNCANISSQLEEIKNTNHELSHKIETLRNQLADVELKLSEAYKNADSLKFEYEQLQVSSANIQKELTLKNETLEKEVTSLKNEVNNAVSRTSDLMTEIEAANAKLLWYEGELQNKNKSNESDHFVLHEKYNALEQQLQHVQSSLEVANTKIIHMESENHDLLQQIKNYELQITELKEKLQNLTTDNDQNSNLVQQKKDYELKINELNEKLQNLNTENDQLLSTVAELRSSVSTAVDQRGFEIAELWKQHLAQRETDFQNTEHELRAQLNASEEKYEKLLDHVQSSSQEETNKLVTMEQVSSLQNKLKDKEDHLVNLQDKYSEVMNQLDMLRSEMEDERHMHENKLLTQQEEYEKQIQEVISRNKENTEGFKPVIQSLETELALTREANVEINQQLLQLNEKLQQAESKIVELNGELQLKDSEIHQKTHEYTIALAQRNEEFENVRKQLVDHEKKVEDLTYEKESELAVLRLKIHDKNQDFDKLRNDYEAEKTNLAQALNDKIVECTNLNKQIVDLNKVLEDHSTKAAETQMVLENQEYEIVTLKDEIASLQDALRATSSKIEKHVRFASDTKPAEGEEEANDLLDAVPRAELDLALYMLHQRDVRCEELTMELTQLLEERDTLQLRLSDSLRSCEEIKSKCVAAGLDVSTSSHETVPESSFSVEREQQFVDTHRGQSRSSSIGDPDGEKPHLQAKLSELRSVKHSRDVLLRHESEARELGMRLLQRDVANLPPEAVHQLTQAQHTLSRDSQSTSTVLLNWLRGKSTPKVVHM